MATPTPTPTRPGRPLQDTPPIPDYDSGHSVEGGAGAEVLKQFFGTDNVAFSTCSTSLPAGSNCGDSSQVMRSYTSFSQGAHENGLSRILVGFHFRDAVTAGIQHGRKIANRAVNHFYDQLTAALGGWTVISPGVQPRGKFQSALEEDIIE